MASNTSLQKRLKTSNEVDRISNLPDSVLCFILSFLETKESVQTCILSKRWKFLWSYVPCLYFHRQASLRKKKKKDTFEKFVTTALLLHKSQSLNKFCLVCEGVTERLNLTLWLSNAIAKDVQVLDISVVCNANNNFIALPGSLFTCTSLEFLKMDGDFLVRVPSLVSLPRLEGLNLKGVRFECDESVRKFIGGCPVLKSLYIDRTRYDNVVVLVVSSPTLKHLEIKALFHDYPEGVFQELEINAPLLEYLHVADYVSRDCTVESLTSLTELCFYGYCFDLVDKVSQGLKFLTLGQNFVVGHIPPNAKLTLNSTWLVKSADLLRLLNSSVHLQVFELEDHSDSPALDETWENHVPECLSSSLRKISISMFSGDESVLGMIKYFLKHGRVLKRVELHPWIDVSKKYEISKKISAFSRMFRLCEVHFLD